MRSDLTDLGWASGGSLIAGSIAVAADSGGIRLIFGLVCVGLLSGAAVTGLRVLRRKRQQPS